MSSMYYSVPSGEVSEFEAWIDIIALIAAGAFASKSNLLFAESRMLRKIACALRLGLSAEEAIGKRDTLHVVFAVMSKGRYTSHGRLLSSAVVLSLNALDIAESHFGVRNSEAIIAFRVLLYLPSLAALGTGGAVAENLRGFSQEPGPAGARRGQVRQRSILYLRRQDFFLFVFVPLCTLVYGIFVYNFGKSYPLQGWSWNNRQWLLYFRWSLVGVDIGIVLREAYVSLMNAGADIGNYAAARIGGKSFADLSFRQKERYLRLRSGDRESVFQSLGTTAVVEFVIYAIISLTGPFLWGLEPDKSLLVRYVVLDSIDLGFVLLKLYNDSVVESQLFMILAQHATDEGLAGIHESSWEQEQTDWCAG